jgi:hypothetical protein
MSNKKQTALQESIKYLNLRKKYLLYGGEQSTTSAINEVDNCIKYLESKLEPEKKQIEDSFETGADDVFYAKSLYADGKEYYKVTYGN